jgi:beta-lactam-binding protein with PASTA domain
VASRPPAPEDVPPEELPPDEAPPPPPPSEARTRVMERRQRPGGPPPPPPPGRRAPPGGVWPWLVALLIVVLGGLAAAYFLTRDDDENKVSVPSLVGVEQAVAVRRAESVGLVVNVNQVASDEEVGLVVDQNPAAGEEVDEGSTVTTDVSSGPRDVTVPNVLGLDEATAGARLDRVSLEVRVVRVPSSQRAGRVVAQSPESGVTVDAGSTVRINVSRGPVPTTTVVTTTTAPTTTTGPTTTTAAGVSVPNLVGNTLSQAVSRLEALGLVPRPTTVNSPEEPGTVVAQNPKPGERVSTGSSVRINIARPEGASP